jgi:CBS domain containing-hemolysin-like protein
MSERVLLWTSIASFALTAMVMLAHRALRSFSRTDLEEVCRRRGLPGRFTEVLREHEQVALGLETFSAFTVAVAIAAGACWAGMTERFSLQRDAWRFAVVALVLGFTLAVVRSWTPWIGARLFAEGFLVRSWPLWRVVAATMTPLMWAAHGFDALLHRIAGRRQDEHDDPAIEEEIRTIVSEGHRGGLIEEEAREMIEGVIDLGDATVSQIMTPRTEMHMLQVDAPWDEVVSEVIESGHTRIPVFDKSRDDILGVLYSKDLLPELATGNPESRTPLRELVRKPLFVPETKAVDDLLGMFQQLRTHIAVVLDEYGGVSGLVTIEDVLEEIVGEIDDEYDPESIEDIERIDENVCLALGRTHIDEINEAMSLELPEDGDFDTIGGLVFSELGRIPQTGESVVWQGRVRIVVVEATKRRVERVRIERIAEEHRESA